MDSGHYTRPTKLNTPFNGKWLYWLVGCPFFFVGCSDVKNDFVVRAPSGDVASAELQLCGKSQPFVQRGSNFSARTPISCEGSGKIIVRRTDGSETSCLIGYVTQGIEASFEYEVKDGACK